MSCVHEDFTANVKVIRFEDKPNVFNAEIEIQCTACGQSMQFIGMPIGLLWTEPSTNALATVAILPMQPYDKPIWFPEEAARMERN